MSREELARAIETWGVFRWCIKKQRRIQLQIWTPDESLARRICAQYERKFYRCRVTRPYLAPAREVFPVTFSQRGTAAVLLWARPKMVCEMHREIARLVWTASELAKRVSSTYGRISHGETRYLFASRRREEFRTAFFAARDSVMMKNARPCPRSAYQDWQRVRDAERATA